MLKISTAAMILALAAAPLAAQDTTTDDNTLGTAVDDTVDTMQEGVDDTVDTMQEGVENGVDAVQEGVDNAQDALDTTTDTTLDADAHATMGADFAVTAPDGYVVLTDWSTLTADAITGADVRDPGDNGIGSVTDLEFDADGQVTGVIADIGGFLGMGTHTVKLGLEDVAIYQHTDGGLIVYTNLSEDALKSMPEYVPPQG